MGVESDAEGVIVIGPMVQDRSILGKLTEVMVHVNAIQLSTTTAVKLEVLMSVSVSLRTCDVHGVYLAV